MILDMTLRGYIEEYTGDPQSSKRHGVLRYLGRSADVSKVFKDMEFSSTRGRHFSMSAAPKIFELDSYKPIISESPTMGIRLASRSLKTEFEHLFLHLNTFEFKCPKAVEDFLDQLTYDQKTQLAYSRFVLWSVCPSCTHDESDGLCCSADESDEGWMSTVSRLPQSLGTLGIGIGELRTARLLSGVPQSYPLMAA